MLQSSIYPDCYGVPCEYFFVIKIQFEAAASVKKNIQLKKLYLKMKDKTKERGSSTYEDVIISIERKLVDKTKTNANGQAEVRPQGAILKPGGPHFEHNILLYTENLG